LLLISLQELNTGKVVPIDKPAGWTSFDVVNRLRSLTGIRKVGHAGTLDPFATGLLLVCFASATKQVDRLMGLEKEYVATFELGKQTDTDDVTGETIQERPFAHVSVEGVEAALEKYHGEFLQTPPAYSAIKVKGTRLYKLARQGKEIQATPRPVTIYDLRMENFSLPEVSVRISCSRGTYIRALARDLGNDLECGAFVRTLRRTRIGTFRVEDAMQIDNFERDFSG
jgi:tRNA pseudouridine55 synthase